ncbi:hypothetical protein JCM10908_002381 [Rhodotorula pacifica]|uniref:uncharacterized protein n=1 Tax=Rhodotorula pacifica TaxID=1495444 RepID=UPI0031717532
MSSESPKTTLLSLPDELLSKIVYEVFAPYNVSFEFSEEVRAVALICRRFLPLVEERAYQRFDYGGDRKLLRWRLNKFEKRPELRALVRHLGFRRVAVYDDDDDDDDEDFGILEASFPPYTAFSKFPHVRTLVLDEALPADIASVLFGPASEAHSSVRRLKISYMTQKDHEVHEAVWWNALSRLPNLEEFALAPEDGSTVLAFNTLEPVTPVLSVHQLEVNTDTNLADGSPDIVRLFPNLNNLRINIEDLNLDAARVDRLLNTAPTALEGLHLSAYLETVVPSLASHLERCTQLQRLRLHRIASLDAILPALQSSSISVLELASDVSDKFLLGLVDGPTRMKCLEALQLDHRWSPSADTARSQVIFACKRGNQGASALVQFKRQHTPRWSLGTTLDGLCKAIDIARPCLVDVTLAEGDWTLIEEYLGKEEAAKAVQRRREQAQVEVEGESTA